MSLRAYDQTRKIVHGVIDAPWRRGPVKVAPACETVDVAVFFNLLAPSEVAITCLACLAVIEAPTATTK